MFRFIFRKMISKKWLFIALLIGNILLCSIAASNPMYSGAVMQRMLSDELNRYLDENNTYPGMVTVQFSGAVTRNRSLPEYDAFARSVPDKLGVPARLEIAHYFLPGTPNTTDIVRDDAKVNNISLGTLTGFESHASIVAGRMFEEGSADGSVIQAVVSQRGLVSMNLLLGEKRTFPSILTGSGEPLTVEVVGVFDIAEEDDPYWVRRPHSYKTEMLISYADFDRLFLSRTDAPVINANWYELLDYAEIRAENVGRMHSAEEELKAFCKNRSFLNIKAAFSDILVRHISTSHKVEMTLWVMQVPMFLLLAAFIFMVSGQILTTEEAEIAVLKSRGVKNRQILTLYLVQSALVALISLVIGVPLGALITRVVGSSNAFLSFVSRTALPVRIDKEACLYAAAAALFSVATMVIPVTRYTRASIVQQKRKKHRSERPLWQKLWLDVICLGVSVYGLYSFTKQMGYLEQQILAGEVPNPLLFLCSSLFILGAGLLAVRLLPLPVALIYRVFKKWWSPALYTSYLRVLRQKNHQNFIMVFLVMTIALGVFNSQTARAINRSAEDNTRYMAGADITLTEVWQSNAEEVEANPGIDLVYYEPDFEVYSSIPGVESVCKVYRNDRGTAAIPGTRDQRVSVIGIDTDDFGRTAWFDYSLLDEHLFSYLNAMSLNDRAVLVSSNFKARGFSLGDVISYSVGENNFKGYIYGFVDYFPGFAVTGYTQNSDGSYHETRNYLIVANLSVLQDRMGVERYSVWLKTNDGGDGVYAWIEESGRRFERFTDAMDQIVAQKTDPMLRSLNGVLTLSFIVALTLCVIGFLIFWILSIRQRTLLFGIYRAMGMTMREIFTMLINEQLCVSLLSILAGFGIGFLASKWFMPLIQLAYASGDSSLPLKNLLSLADTARLGAVVGVMLVMCLTVLVTIIRSMKISQALKLGED